MEGYASRTYSVIGARRYVSPEAKVQMPVILSGSCEGVSSRYKKISKTQK